MSLLGPAVSVNVEREVCELPVERTAKTGCEVNQSGSCSPFTHAAVVPCPHWEGMPLNDMEFSITQPDDVNCNQVDNAVGRGPSTPSSTDEVFVSGESFEQSQPDDVNCNQFGNAVGRGPSTPSLSLIHI